MKVFMLGWEFPPHISGGLGTACYGLTRGLHEHGVEVELVVPRRFGDEDRRYASIIGCNDVRLSSVMRRTGVSVQTVVSAGRSGGLAVSGHTVSTADTAVFIDSSLSPYDSEASYADRLDAGPSGLRLSPPPVETTTGAHESTGESNERGIEVPTTSPPSTSLRGHYGRDLMHEVMRYRDIVAHLAQAERFDVIHAHDWMTYPAAEAARARTGCPMVVHLHATEFDRSATSPNWAIRDLERAGLWAADRVICVSHYTASIAREQYGVPAEKIRVVHNAVLHDDKPRPTDQKTLRAPLVLFLGRVTRQKGPDYFLQAARRVVDVEPQTRFVMAGNGDMLVAMIEETARLGLAENVHFTGFLTGADVERMYAMADVYVMPSVSEPFGIAPLEAMALDVPVIVSKQSGVSEVLRHALKVDFWDVDELASKILAVLREDSLRRELVARGREDLRQMQWSLRGRHVAQIYEELLV